MMKFTCRSVVGLLLLVCASCQSMSHPDVASHGPGVTHVVICWQKHSGDAAERRALLDAAVTLRAIPGVQTVSAGTMLPSTRPVVDSTWDVAYVITFADQQTMNAYLSNPRHIQLKHEVLDPNVRQIKIYDLAAP